MVGPTLPYKQQAVYNVCAQGPQGDTGAKGNTGAQDPQDDTGAAQLVRRVSLVTHDPQVLRDLQFTGATGPADMTYNFSTWSSGTPGRGSDDVQDNWLPVATGTTDTYAQQTHIQMLL